MHQMTGEALKSSLRRLVLILVVTIFVGGLFLTFKYRQSTILLEAQITELKKDFPEFLAERLKIEKKDSKLLKVEIVSVDRDLNGLFKISYSLFFDDVVAGKLTPSSVEATAFLQKSENEIWKVVKITTKKETVDF